MSLTSHPCVSPINFLRVRSHVIKEKDRKNFAMCVAPLHGPYNSTTELIQWIEMNRILGADYFMFYNLSTSRYIDHILNYYRRQHLLEVIPWNISKFPPGSENEMHYLGQHAAMNDCLMRVKNLSKFAVNCDIDEVMVPHSNLSTWHDIIEHTPEKGGYLFQNSFFRLNWKNVQNDFPDKHSATKYDLFFLFKLRRETKVFRARLRSKYFVRTDVTELMGTHEVFAMKPGYWTYTLPVDVGLLHHYRTIYADVNGTFIPDPNNNIRSVIDDSVYRKYRDKLVHNVVAVYSEIERDKV